MEIMWTSLFWILQQFWSWKCWRNIRGMRPKFARDLSSPVPKIYLQKGEDDDGEIHKFLSNYLDVWDVIQMSVWAKIMNKRFIKRLLKLGLNFNSHYCDGGSYLLVNRNSISSFICCHTMVWYTIIYICAGKSLCNCLICNVSIIVVTFHKQAFWIQHLNFDELRWLKLV